MMPVGVFSVRLAVGSIVTRPVVEILLKSARLLPDAFQTEPLANVRLAVRVPVLLVKSVPPLLIVSVPKVPLDVRLPLLTTADPVILPPV